MCCPMPPRNRKPIYALVQDPMGILIPTYSAEEYERVTRNVNRMALVFGIMMMASGVTGLAVLLYALFNK